MFTGPNKVFLVLCQRTDAYPDDWYTDIVGPFKNNCFRL